MENVPEIRLTAEALQATVTAGDLIKKADEVIIETDEQLEAATTLRSWIGAHYKKLEAIRLDMAQPFNAALKNLNSHFRVRLDPLDLAKKTVGDKMQTYMVKREAAKRAEAERLRKEDEERARRDREAREAAALAEAERLQAAGDTAAADEVIERASEPEAIPVPAPMPTPRGGPVRGVMGGTASLRRTVAFRLDPALDPEEAVARVPRHLLVPPDERLNRRMIRAAINSKDDKIPGLEIYEETGITGR